jgi:hypothetical protein
MDAAKNLSQDSRGPNRDANRTPSEYKSDALTLQPALTVVPYKSS